MGAPFIDYIIADRFLVPEGSEGFYSEQVVRAAGLLPAERYEAEDRRADATAGGAGFAGARRCVLLVQQI